MERKGYYCSLYETQQELERYARRQSDAERREKRARSGVKVMAGLIGMIKPLLPFMFAAILMGCAGNLMATFITILGGFGVRQVLGLYQGMTLSHILFRLRCLQC